MGGNNCKHENLEIIDIYNTEKNNLGLFIKEYAHLHCKDCGSDFDAERTRGGITSHQYGSWQKISEYSCLHSNFTVVKDTIKVESVRDPTLGTTLLGFLGPTFRDIDIKSYLVAYGECNRCKKKFVVTSDYHTELRNEGKESVRIEHGWKKMMVKEKINTPPQYKDTLRQSL